VRDWFEIARKNVDAVGASSLATATDLTPGINVDDNMHAQGLPQLTKTHSQPSPDTRARIKRQRGVGMEIFAVESAPVSELQLTLTPREGETPAALVGRLVKVLDNQHATLVRQIAFGSLAACPPMVEALTQAFGSVFPLTWVEGRGCTNHPIAGLQVHAVSGAKVRSEQAADGSVACVWDDATARHCVLSALGPRLLAISRPRQTSQTLEYLQGGLDRAGMTMKDVARTWFFLDDILAWYGDFNHARNDFFAHCELRAGSVPASTGVSGRNPAGSALTAVAWATRSHDRTVKPFQVVSSPLQGPAPSYGSAFSRAVEIQSAGFRQLLVSGTASIAPDGRTEHVGNVRGQIELSMQVVEAILESRQMTFADVSRATAYFRSATDVAIWEDWRARHELRAMPVVCACCDICRDDLLFEIELDAIRVG
jgi:enamine deaminase RidA (YjgF/YER057c/UK114 family)